jgi:membrane associated rhomboid family serine protease
MIPLRDNIPPRTFPFVNYSIIAICVVVFLGQLADTADGTDQLVDNLGMIPARVFHPDEPITVQQQVLVRTPFGVKKEILERDLPALPFSPWLTLFTCIFLHGGWMHVIGNMWFLHIFGDNVEDRLGHFSYLLFYVGCGIAASIAHLVLNASSTMPTIGASGAIAGVMGAYLYLYPRANVVTLVPIIFFLQVIVVPAPVFLIIWFAMQFFEGTFAITSQNTGGVAWWAHIGGFAAGLVVAWLLEQIHQLRPPVQELRPNTQRPTVYRYRRPPSVYED